MPKIVNFRWTSNFTNYLISNYSIEATPIRILGEITLKYCIFAILDIYVFTTFYHISAELHFMPTILNIRTIPSLKRS